MGDVFGYFMAIGAGLATGLIMVAIPSYSLYRWLNRRDRGKKNAW